jgi:ribosomal-protein-alanine N-acetyltransferase
VSEGTLMDICVSPDKQGNSYGKTFLEDFFEQARQLNNMIVWLEVRAKGFGYEDAIVMKKTL